MSPSLPAQPTGSVDVIRAGSAVQRSFTCGSSGAVSIRPMVPDPASLRDYLAQAEVERADLERALEAARSRRRMAESLARTEVHRTDRLGSELDDLTRHLDEERRATWHEAQAVLAEAEVEAAAILDAARATADEILSGDRPRPPRSPWSLAPPSVSPTRRRSCWSDERRGRGGRDRRSGRSGGGRPPRSARSCGIGGAGGRPGRGAPPLAARRPRAHRRSRRGPPLDARAAARGRGGPAGRGPRRRRGPCRRPRGRGEGRRRGARAPGLRRAGAAPHRTAAGPWPKRLPGRGLPPRLCTAHHGRAPDLWGRTDLRPLAARRRGGAAGAGAGARVGAGRPASRGRPRLRAPSLPLSVADERGFAAFWQEETEAPERGVARDLTATVFGALGVVALLALYLVLVG